MNGLTSPARDSHTPADDLRKRDATTTLQGAMEPYLYSV